MLTSPINDEFNACCGTLFTRTHQRLYVCITCVVKKSVPRTACCALAGPALICLLQNTLHIQANAYIHGMGLYLLSAGPQSASGKAQMLAWYQRCSTGLMASCMHGMTASCDICQWWHMTIQAKEVRDRDLQKK
jgi:hypothetical protein